MDKKDKIFIAGHEGMIGRGVLEYLAETGYANVVTPEADLSNQESVSSFFSKEKPDYVFLTTTKMGGIMANRQNPADFIYTNLQIQNNVIEASRRNGVKKLLFWGSSCAYPKECPQPMKEEYLMTGPLEPTSEPYAIAKIAGMKMCLAYNRQYGTRFISAIPADVYGPHDDFNPETGHFLPALIHRVHEAKRNNAEELVLWGTGAPRRECLHVKDLASASVFLMEHYNGEDIINIGSGTDYSIEDIAVIISGIIGYKGKIGFDASKPDGSPRKLLDITRLKNMGWSPRIAAEQGILQTCQWYLEHIASGR